MFLFKIQYWRLLWVGSMFPCVFRCIAISWIFFWRTSVNFHQFHTRYKISDLSDGLVHPLIVPWTGIYPSLKTNKPEPDRHDTCYATWTSTLASRTYRPPKVLTASILGLLSLASSYNGCNRMGWSFPRN